VSAAFRATAGELREAVAGRLLNGPPDALVDGFSIDTRTLRAGDMYFAIRGERFDGHAFVQEALDKGALGAVVSTPPDGISPVAVGDRVLIAVKDTTRALQHLARWTRRRSNAIVVAITGSAGKTTTKEITAAFLGDGRKVMRSGGNLNNHIGLPLSLLELRHGADTAVVELGMNHAGEISRLVAIAEPDVRVWTNVAEVHTEFFPSIEAIADAKAEVLERAGAGTVLVANADDPRVMARVRAFPGRLITFGFGLADVRALEVEDRGLEGTTSLLCTPSGEARWRVPLPGRANLSNALAAAAVGLHFGVSAESMAGIAASLRPAAHRGEIVALAGGVTVLDDAYNSNPRALQAVLQVVAADSAHTRRVAVLGEMLELGDTSTSLHQECGRSAAAARLSHLLAVGGEPARALAAAAVAAGMPSSAVTYLTSSEEAAAAAGDIVRPGDLVLVKGSRGMRMERVVARLVAQLGRGEGR